MSKVSRLNARAQTPFSQTTVGQSSEFDRFGLRARESPPSPRARDQMKIFFSFHRRASQNDGQRFAARHFFCFVVLRRAAVGAAHNRRKTRVPQN